jgi:hypothetical protein
MDLKHFWGGCMLLNLTLAEILELTVMSTLMNLRVT